MGYLETKHKVESWKIEDSKMAPDYFKAHDAIESDYHPDEQTRTVLGMIISHFAKGDINMQKPRVEFNDTSVLQRAQLDEMNWNTYQPNNGQPVAGDVLNSWKSNAIRPVIRNKCISIAAHATARLIFPKVFAYNNQSEIQEDAAHAMEDLMEWSGDQSNYSYNALNRTISALVYPASIGYTEYSEAYRTIKEIQPDGSWIQKTILDEELSGFQDYPVPVDQLYISNFYEPDIQKQSWLIWRRVRDYSLLESIYKACYPNFKYVKPGVQLIYNDANQTFYQVYDTVMRPEMCEEIIYWNRALDLKIILVNGVMLTSPDNPNPRLDKLYPFDKFGYELINTRCFYYKSLAFKLQQDANIVNTLYPMIIDGTYLQIMPAMVNVGGEAITSEVIVPGAVTTLSSPDADLRAINTSNPAGLKTGMETLFKVDESINESSSEPVLSGKQGLSGTTAYEISRIEQNANTVLGLFIKMIQEHVRQYGRLRIGDIVQYLTIADVSDITDNGELVYKTFILPSRGKSKNKKIKFDNGLAEVDNTEGNALAESFKTLKAQGGIDSNEELARINPELFRGLKFKVAINPDIMNPRSEDLERAFKLEAYDRAIQNPLVDQEAITKDFLFGAYRNLVDNPDKYIKEQEGPLDLPQIQQEQTNAKGRSPLMSMMAQSKSLPQTMGLTQ